MPKTTWEWMTLPYKRYADFQGRSRRREFWLFVLLQFLGLIALMLVLMPFGYDPEDERYASPGSGVVLLFLLAHVIPNLAVQVRRLHDQDRSGWYILLALIPYLGTLVLLVLMCIDGTPGRNQYGDSPKVEGVDPEIFS